MTLEGDFFLNGDGWTLRSVLFSANSFIGGRIHLLEKQWRLCLNKIYAD